MEGGLKSVYLYYNSVITDGRRVRRMRRTQLSDEKLRNSLYRKKGEMQITRSTQKQRQISKSRSIPKIQPRRNIQQKASNNKNHIQNVQRQYYTQIKNNIPVNDFSKRNSKNDSNSRSGNGKINLSRQLSNASKSRNIQNSFIKTLKQNYKQISLLSNQQRIVYVQQCLNCKNSQSRTQKLANQRKSNSKQLSINKSQNKNLNNSSCLSNSRKKFENISNHKKLSNQIGELKIDQYGFGQNLQSNVQKSNLKSKLKSKLQSHNSKLVQNANDNIASGSKISIRQFTQSKINSEIISNRSQDQQSYQRNKMSTNSKISQNRKKQQNQIKNLKKSHTSFQQFDQIFTKQVSNLNSVQRSNFSKLKIQTTGNPIINSSNVQRQNWKDAIRSLTQLDSSNNQMQSQSQNQKTSNNFYESKKLSLKLDSMREDNYQHQDDKNSDRFFLSLASKDINQRKSLGSINSLNSGSDIGSLKGVIESIQIHDFIINLINQFKEETYKLGEGEHETQLLCFLLERKYFLQKSNIVKALKGGRNIFKLSSIEIPTEILKKYLDTPEIKNIIRNLETEKVKIFKQLQKNYHQLKLRHKNNQYFQFQTPSDTFSKQIVRILNEQIQQLYNQLQNTEKQDQQQLIQNRIFQIMEQIFLLSQLNGRPVKKIEFIDEISDFQSYYKQNQPILKKTVKYFQNLK